MSAPLELKGVTCGYSSQPIISNLSLSIEAGEVCAVLGPNGVGKTTLFKSVLGHLPLLGGQVLIDGQDAKDMSRSQLARKVGYVPQAHTPSFPYTVVEVAEMGRTAHLPLTAVPSKHDRQLAMEALNRMGIAHLHNKPCTEISGGERQLVLIARALCQQASLLIMDEPCANLDFGNRARVLREVRALADEGISVLVTTHDPDHALTSADSVIAILDSTEHAVGTPVDVITAQLLERMYDIPAAVSQVATASGPVPVAVPIP